VGDNGDDEIVGGAGFDVVSYEDAAVTRAPSPWISPQAPPQDLGKDALTTIEGAAGGYGADTLIGDDGPISYFPDTRPPLGRSPTEPWESTR
jgi:Ca2+-binding RTX toxin-like protein